MRKETILTFVCCCAFAGALVAQANCSLPLASISLDPNNITARIRNSGVLFNQGGSPEFIYTPQASGPSSIYSAGLWLGGNTVDNGIKLATATYFAGDFYPGPIDAATGEVSNASCQNWNRVFSVTSARIAEFTAQLPQLAQQPALAISQFPDILGWPAQGNPHFSAVHNFELPQQQSLAGFWDNNSDGIYNPLEGDYPAVMLRNKPLFVPDQIVWCVFNDLGGPHLSSNGGQFGMEVQLTAWAFKSTEPANLANTIFTSHKLIYRGLETVTDFRMGVWADFDLGCYFDDFVGCNPARNTFFAYNQDAVDGQPGNNCPGIPGFELSPVFEFTPVQTVTLLDQPMASFMTYVNPGTGNPITATTDPALPDEYLNYLHGKWRNSLPLTVGESGFDFNASGTITTFAYPDDPADPEGWSLCTANQPNVDRRAVGAADLGTLLPGAVNEVSVAWTLHPNILGPCNLGNSLEQVDSIQQVFDSGFAGVVSAPEKLLLDSAFKLFPNPAQEVLHLDYQGLTVQAIRCYDPAGRLVLQDKQPAAGAARLSVQSLQPGVYFLQVFCVEGLVNRRFVVAGK